MNKKKTSNKIFKNNSVRNNRGTTMLETLVAFTVLMVIMSVLYSIIAFCSELQMSAMDTGRIMKRFDTEIYNTKNLDVPNTSTQGVKVISTPESDLVIKKYTTDKGNQQPLFYLKVSSKTSSRNIGYTGVYHKPLSLSQIEATTYAYKGEEKDIVPKAIVFTHK